MPKNEFEEYLVGVMEKVREEYQKYCPEDVEDLYLTMCIRSDTVFANNAYWKDDINHKVDLWKFDKEEM